MKKPSCEIMDMLAVKNKGLDPTIFGDYETHDYFCCSGICRKTGAVVPQEQRGRCKYFLAIASRKLKTKISLPLFRPLVCSEVSNQLSQKEEDNV